jgi:D-serine deaminase-like pyridoxal phosphate-dependent protein
VAGYEGTIGGTDAQALGRVASFCRRLANLAAVMAGEGELIVTAGGSVYFDVVTRELTAGGSGVPAGMTVVLRSGGYLFHDHGLYQAATPATRGVAGAPVFRPALELWAQVVSRPEPGLALLSAGRRDAGFDAGLPVPLRARRRDGGAAALAGAEVTGLNDQHAYLRLAPGTALAPGDLVCLGISHPCTTLDKWRVIPVLDEEDRVIDAVHTFF